MKLYKTAEEIAAAVGETAKAINASYAASSDDSRVLIVCVLKGAAFFFSDLARKLTFPFEIDFVRTSSYGSGRQSSGNVKFLKDVEASVEGRRVLIVEDIVETGISLDFLRRHFLERGAADVKIAVLLDKPTKRKVDVPVDFRAFEAPDVYLVGYGLDDAEAGRGLPDLRYVE
ncbi:MAG: hypoxanthine phosphoribosyltransferase [Thermoguttaceae bacterium]|jgi:hypoxanthine phosphoribosyltransferase|nr:hypoxanthine phosphoribosyltransferase [Thermoguttaceae bacterium]MBR4752388.1 hypoxanthine phosphoribosyltransferase [Thermoguttaceae bacterium]MBR5757571.1 hypoxanthine phosphoribosyltransferase [Thermoguttaceae bacterium]